LGLATGGDFLRAKGVLETVLEALHVRLKPAPVDRRLELLTPGRAVELRLGDERWGFLGEVSEEGLARFDLRGPATVAEVRLEPLVRLARLAPQARDLSPFPAVSRDLNFVVDESVRWAALEEVVRRAAGPELESLRFEELYRDPARLGAGKKSLLLSAHFRASGETLTGAAVDAARDRIVAAARAELGAELRA
jgi:phenylalanyl-tRNA synthetase beta chain